MADPEMGTIELVQGSVIEQRFSTKHQILGALFVQWGTFYRTNSGAVTMEL